MTETKPDYTTDNPHDHAHDDDDGVPFWKRAAVTEGQYAALRRELREVRAERDALKTALQLLYDDWQGPDTSATNAARFALEPRN